jgi:hypothetical protein
VLRFVPKARKAKKAWLPASAGMTDNTALIASSHA